MAEPDPFDDEQQAEPPELPLPTFLPEPSLESTDVGQKPVERAKVPPKEPPEPPELEPAQFEPSAEPEAQEPPELPLPGEQRGGMSQGMSLRERHARWEAEGDSELPEPGLTASADDIALAQRQDVEARQQWQAEHPVQQGGQGGGEGSIATLIEKADEIIGLLGEIKDATGPAKYG